MLTFACISLPLIIPYWALLVTGPYWALLSLNLHLSNTLINWLTNGHLDLFMCFRTQKLVMSCHGTYHNIGTIVCILQSKVKNSNIYDHNAMSYFKKILWSCKQQIVLHWAPEKFEAWSLKQKSICWKLDLMQSTFNSAWNSIKMWTKSSFYYLETEINSIIFKDKMRAWMKKIFWKCF